MKRVISIYFICLFLFISPIYSRPGNTDTANSDPYVPAADNDIQRVYGIDLSQQVFNSVSMNSYRNFIIHLTENGSRPAGFPFDLGARNIAARNWIAEQLKEVSDGRIEVEILGHYASVLGKLPGYLPVDAPALMVGGHYDSVPAAPGANDDATGVAAALELARVMSRYNWPLDIYFGAWNAEENGLLGSTEVAKIMKDRGVDLLAYYNVDMLLVPDPDAPVGSQALMVYPVGYYHEGAYWADIARAMSQNYGQHMILPVMSSDFSSWERSDHYPFWQQGYTALFAHESGFVYDTAYHTSQDTWTNPLYDYQVAAEAVKAIGSAMAFTMARTYGEPTNLSQKFTLIPSHNKNLTFAISTPTIINVTARWWGGGTTITLFDPNDQLVTQMVDPGASPWEYTQIMSQSVESEGLYRLNVANHGGTGVGHEISITYDTDIDGNEVLDSNEFWFDSEFFSLDSDLDTITDGQEMLIGTLASSSDSDSDTLPDAWEIENGLDPLDPSDAAKDNDSDGVVNTVEFAFNCSPNNPDSDFDNMPDLWEIQNGLNPAIDDSLGDPDHDGVTNIQEYEEGTNPNYAEFRFDRFAAPIFVVGSVVALVAVGYAKRSRLQRFE
jgi:hypothetical protein